MNRRWHLCLVISAVVTCWIQARSVNAQTDSENVTAQVAKIVAAHRGQVAVYAEDFATQQVVAIHADIPVKTASVIKLAILYEALEEIREGKARWDEPIVLEKDDRVDGSGILTFLDAPLTLTLRDVLTLMIDVSDNTATNLMIDRFSTASVNARMASIGLAHTYLYKKISKPATEPMPADQPKFGLGKTTAREMASLIARFGRCQLSSDRPSANDFALCSAAVEMLQHQFYRDAIPRYLETIDTSETGTAIANKTGSLNAVRNDVALIGTKKGLVVLSVFTYDNADQSWASDNAAELTIGRIAKVIVQSWSPEGLSPETLRQGAGAR